jgi:predicted dehydrogenase
MKTNRRIHSPSAALPPRRPTVLTRRDFLARSAAMAALAIVPRHVLGGAGQVPPSAKTTLAGIGLGGQGLQDMVAFQAMPEVQVTAVCDVNREGTGYISWNWSQGREEQKCGREPARKLMDESYARQGRSGQYRGCRAYSDYRELLDKEDVDAVMIATPDHTHAVITMAALKRRKHVYCEKPLTYSVEEARLVTEAARRAGVATQCGNQGQATEAARLVREMIADGAIGAVREVQVWSPARFWSWPSWDGRPTETPPVPEGLDWDLWIGPAPSRPYHPAYHPWTWRNWLDFGTGLLGDLGLHKLSTVFKALRLGTPVSVEASATKLSTETYPLGEIVRFEFPARGEMPPVSLTWSDGGLKPPRPPELDADDPMRDIIYIGDQGKIMGERLIPETRMETYKRPPKTLPRSPGHYEEWIAACRGGAPAGSNFVEHSGLLTEVCLLGNIAVRAQKKLLWDGANLRFTNDATANKMLRRDYRKGWAL